MREALKYSFIKTIPVMCGYLFTGLAFGLLLQNIGYSFIWAFFISLFVYAGSMQYVLVTLLAGSFGLPTVVIMTLLINSRHAFYGLSFIERFKKMGRLYPYMVFSLTDETYSLLCATVAPQNNKEKWTYFFIALLDHFYWIMGSVAGAIIGNLITFDLTGIDFAMTALFMVIFVEQWIDAKSHIAAVTGVLSAIIFLILIGPDKFILPSLVVTVLILNLLRNILEEKKVEGV
ncbi:MAG TPA: branched-chain amino acid ABC transporter permease [Lachnospiraceae bacterium]|nr:branched-chain amino acid ABC transporter permease [Lachnospiraceae bacterium]